MAKRTKKPARKKSSRKKKATRKAPAPKGAVRNEGNVEPRRRTRATKYDWVFEKIKGIKPGKVVVLDPPRGVDVETFQNRLTSAMGYCPHEPPKGFTFTRFITSDDKVAVGLKKA